MKRKYHDNREPLKECNKIKYDKENFESEKVYQRKKSRKKNVFNKTEKFHQ